MMNTKKLGIWMDHSHAHLIEFTSDPMTTTTISSDFTHAVKGESIQKSEGLMHHKEQHNQASYYNHLGQQIKSYTDVLLFGPTEAKDELFNLLRSNHSFDKIHITVQNTDKMTEHQMHAFVKESFSKHATPTEMKA
jgi:hypothetical protein